MIQCAARTSSLEKVQHEKENGIRVLFAVFSFYGSACKCLRENQAREDSEILRTAIHGACCRSKAILYVGTNRHHLHSMYEALSLMPGSPINPNMLPADLWPMRLRQPVVLSGVGASLSGRDLAVHSKNSGNRVHQSGCHSDWATPRQCRLPMGTRALAEFKGYLYALRDRNVDASGANSNSVLRSASGDPGTWEDVSGIIRGTTNIRAITEWKGKLYVAASVSDGMIPGRTADAVVFESADPGDQKMGPVSIPGFGGTTPKSTT